MDNGLPPPPGARHASVGHIPSGLFCSCLEATTHLQSPTFITGLYMESIRHDQDHCWIFPAGTVNGVEEACWGSLKAEREWID